MLTPFLLLAITISQAQENYLLVGTYNSPKSEGIYVFRFNSNDGSFAPVSSVKTSNPSFLAISPDEKYVYAVNEKGDSTNKGGVICSFSFDKKTGSLQFINQQSSLGNNPCYIATDKTGRSVMVVNYSTGNYARYTVNNGRIDTAINFIQRNGSGPDSSRQKSSHLHGIFPNENLVYITDLGADEINAYTGSPGVGNDMHIVYKTEPGGGPRHLAFHASNKFFYVIDELTSTIEVFDRNKKTSIQSISALPLFYKGPAGGSADIHISPDGRFLYVSNRGQSNTIGIYLVDPKNGQLSFIDHVSSGGERPRNFNFDPSGKFLLVENQMSDEIAIFKRDVITGMLTDTGKRISVGRPVCLKWISIK